MATNRPKSPKERRDAKNARSFIGRTEQQDQFERSLVQPEHRDAKVVFSISGQGGVGKTTLLKEFRRIVEKHGHVAAYVNEGLASNRVDDVPEAMHRLVEDLEAQGFKFEKFRERYKAYRVKKQEMEADPEAPKGMLREVTRGATKVALDLSKASIPLVGGMIDSDSISSGVGDAVNYGWEKFRNKDEERLVKETLEVLTPLFLEGMKKIPADKHLVLMFDAYEFTGGFLDEWIRALLDNDYGVLDMYLFVCIGGRHPIDRNAWIEWEQDIARSPLEPFTESEAREFLAGQGIQSEAVIKEIWRLSSDQAGAMGLPLLISMMAASAPTSADAVVDPCEDAVNRFLQWETDRVKRDLAQDAACARVLNVDVVAVLGEGMQFEWLRGSAFVLKEGSGWRYHSIVREQMLRYLGQKSPKRYAEVHWKLAAYYDGLRNGLGLEVGKEAEDEAWRKYSLEWIYHELNAAPAAQLGSALNELLWALKQWSKEFALDILETMIYVGAEVRCEVLRLWGEQLKGGFKALIEGEGDVEAFLPCLNKLMSEPSIEKILVPVILFMQSASHYQLDQYELALEHIERAVAMDTQEYRYHAAQADIHEALKNYEKAIESYTQAIKLTNDHVIFFTERGKIYRLMNCHKEAVQDFNRAIELNPTDLNFGQRGQTYRLMKRYEEALKDFDQAIELNPTGWKFGQRGETYRLMENYEEALKDFDQAVELDSEWAWAIASRGQTYQALKRYEEALKDFDQAVELNPTNWNFGQRGETYRLMKRYEEALKDFSRAIELNDEWSWVIASRGQTYQALKRYEEALKDFDRAVKLNPTDWNFGQRGETYRLMENYEEALKDFDQSIELDSEWSWVIASRGQTYQALKRYEEALKDFDQAVELDSEWAWAIASRGQTYHALKRYEEALKDFDRAVELDSEWTWAIASRGQTYRALKRYEEALKDFDRAAEFNSADLDFGHRGQICRLMKRYEEALKDFDQAIEFNPTDWNFGQRGETYRLMENYEEALKDFSRSIELNGEYYWVIASRGQTYQALRRYEEALKDFDRAIELDNEYSWAIASRGETYQALKRYEEALKDFDRAIELDSEYSWAIASRGETYQALRHYEEALKDFDRSIELEPTAWKFSQRGQIYNALERYDNALQDFAQAIELDPEDEWDYHLRALTNIKLNHSELVNNDFQKAISIAQLTYEKDPTDWCNTFNLALYHLAAANQEESDRLYTSNLTAPKEWLEMAISDLDDFLHLFPDHSQAQQVKAKLQGAIDTPDAIALQSDQKVMRSEISP